MPTTYAHDLFGKKIYKKLPEEMRRILKENKDLFRIGLHGPDVLFYFMFSKNPVSSYGVKMHHTNAREFFEANMKLARETKDEQLLAYILGFACHFYLDSTCHPYVIRMAETGKISHTNLEKEMDRELMMQNGLDPHHYYPSDCIVPKYEYAKVIHKAIPKIPTVCIWLSMHMMKLLTNLMVNDDEGRKRKIAHYATGLISWKAQTFVVDYIMNRHMKPRDWKYVKPALDLYKEAVDVTPKYLIELYGLYDKESTLCNRWDRTYNI
ncbi:MAG: zinc dependent phospholipase C family protein [Eubacteriales bacterium]|nr:zinc dependent phospholipase C family protein [Eubacteriales bacterium]